MIIAIDGPGASGKGTLARRLARAYDFAYLDSGLLYRAVAAKVLAAGKNLEPSETAVAAAEGLVLKDLERAGLRDERCGQIASVVAAIPAVRHALLGLQRSLAESPPGGKVGAVLDGRDIGTVVCPRAQVKLFVTASLETRAWRRHKELLGRGEASIYARVMQEMQERDIRDRDRKIAPLRPALDAIVLDTSEMDADQAFQAAQEIIASRHPTNPA